MSWWLFPSFLPSVNNVASRLIVSTFSPWHYFWAIARDDVEHFRCHNSLMSAWWWGAIKTSWAVARSHARLSCRKQTSFKRSRRSFDIKAALLRSDAKRTAKWKINKEILFHVSIAYTIYDSIKRYNSHVNVETSLNKKHFACFLPHSLFGATIEKSFRKKWSEERKDL